MKCCHCSEAPAALKRPKDGSAVCRSCFFHLFEEEIHQVIQDNSLFRRGERVAIGASGGKDSTVLAHVLHCLNQRHDYGLELILLSIDEGITGYRDDSLKAVARNQAEYGLPLKILGYDELFGWTMDRVVGKIGRRNNCTFCGVFRRQALDKGAEAAKVDKVATGHNADDIAETVVMNLLRGDVARLARCTQIVTGAEDGESIPRVKPLKYAYEKEIVLYAHFKRLDYFSTECIYSPNAYRGYARSFIKEVERIRPRAILDIIRSGEEMGLRDEVRLPTLGKCTRCGYLSSQPVCKGCLLLEGLNSDDPWLGVRKTKRDGRPRKAKLSPDSANQESQPPSQSSHSSTHQCLCQKSDGVDF